MDRELLKLLFEWVFSKTHLSFPPFLPDGEKTSTVFYNTTLKVNVEHMVSPLTVQIF